MNRRDLLKTAGLAGAGVLLPAGRKTWADARQPVSAQELFEHYERRFAEARLRLPDRHPAAPAERQAIARLAKQCLGIRDEWVPTIEARPVRSVDIPGARVELLRATSWPGVTATALLYRPLQPARRSPLVVLCCGHGVGGKLCPGYQRMARHLVRCGTMVLCPDNIGQGERKPMGHADCVKPFACGLSVQGLIVMETLGWVAWARRLPEVDPQRLAAIGNSGGGTLTVFLAGLCPDLAVLSSSGYPSTFEFVACKEKKHCHCNILPGVVGQLEMWHLLGSFAPRPLFIFQGALDSLFPQDLFYSVARKVRHAYAEAGADAALEAKIQPGEHSWDEKRVLAMGKFLTPRLGLARPASPADPAEPLLSLDDRCVASWPADALDADALSEQLSGRRVDNGLQLCDVFPPPVPRDVELADVAPRGTSRQIFAQFEAFLCKPGTAREA